MSFAATRHASERNTGEQKNMNNGQSTTTLV